MIFYNFGDIFSIYGWIFCYKVIEFEISIIA